MELRWPLWPFCLLVVFMVFGSYVSAKNQMVAKDQAVKAAWSEVDVQLERRADLIPNLVATVKGFTKEESTVFGDIANARAGLMNAQGPAGQNRRQQPARWQPSAGCSLLTENYPQLRSSDQFMRLQDELSGTENRIAWRANATTTRFRTTTPSCCSSPTASGRAWPASSRTTPTSPPARHRKPCLK